MINIDYNGYLDEVTESRVWGWVVNSDNLMSGTYIFIKTNHRVLKITPTLHRLDVQNTLGGDGMCGFYYSLPEQQEYSFWSKFKKREVIEGVYFANGAPIKSSKGRGADTSEWLRMGTVNYFLHIQKTAGTSLRNALNAALKPDELVYIYPNIPGMKGHYKDLSLEQVKKIKLVYGHYYFNLHRYQPTTFRYYTILRNPNDRIRSQILHIARSLKMSWQEVLRKHFEQFCFEELDNYYVRILAAKATNSVSVGQIGAAHLDLALSNITNYFGAVATLDDDLPTWFRQHFGIELGSIGQDNASKENADGLVSDPLFIKLCELNNFDNILYQIVRKNNG